MPGRPCRIPSLKHGRRGCVIVNSALPIRRRSPIRGLEQPLGREILPERAPRQVRGPQPVPPPGVVLRWIRVHGLVNAAVYREIRLPVAIQVELSRPHPGLDRGLEDGGDNHLASPLHFARQADTHSDHAPPVRSGHAGLARPCACLRKTAHTTSARPAKNRKGQGTVIGALTVSRGSES